MNSDIKFETNKDKENNKNNKCSELINFPKEEEKIDFFIKCFFIQWLVKYKEKKNE